MTTTHALKPEPGEAAPFKVVDAERIPAERYYDKAFYKLENERLWPHVWQMACRLEQIPNIGDWVEYKILDKSVLVVRTKAGVKAYHNVCRHRGVQLASGAGNCETAGFTCPFHGWRWNAEGANTFVYARHMFTEHQLDRTDLALTPCRVEQALGCAFINFDNDAPSLHDCLGPVLDRLEVRNADKLKVDWWRATILPVNWKLAMEAFMEGYHVMRTHPQLHALTFPGTTAFEPEEQNRARAAQFSPSDYRDMNIRHLIRLHEGMAGMVSASEAAIVASLKDMELPGDLRSAGQTFYMRLMQEITVQERARGVPVPDLVKLAATHPVHAVEFMFPHFFLLPMFSAMASYRVRPLGPETCLFEMWSLSLYPEDETLAPPLEPAPVPYDDPSIPEIPLQDYSNLPLQQIGLHAKGFEYMRLAKDVEGMISNYQRLIDGYLEQRDPAVLAAATRAVGTGYDAPIVDIGF